MEQVSTTHEQSLLPMDAIDYILPDDSDRRRSRLLMHIGVIGTSWENAPELPQPTGLDPDVRFNYTYGDLLDIKDSLLPANDAGAIWTD